MFNLNSKKLILPLKSEALKGRETPILPKDVHAVLGTSLLPEYPKGIEIALFGMGCFWGCERMFWQQPGVYTTAVGYSAGFTPNPSYEEVCTGMTAHNEVVMVVYWPAEISYQQLLALFWENHNPTQGMSQANDKGTQYRSGIYYFSQEQKQLAELSLDSYQKSLNALDKQITTEIKFADTFYFAETYHQQYLSKNPGGYCNLQQISKTGLPAFNLKTAVESPKYAHVLDAPRKS